VDSRDKDVVAARLDDLFVEGVGEEDLGRLGLGVELDRAELVVVDLVERGKLGVGTGKTVHLGRLKDDARGRGAGQLGRLADERPALRAMSEGRVRSSSVKGAIEAAN
jgi:hypothetical protein